jgi:transporter family-2 protein
MGKYIALTAIAGFLLPLQALINTRLGSLLTGPLSAALANFVVGLTALLAVMAVLGTGMPTVPQMLATPWWSWLGGTFGAFFIFAAATSVPYLGAAGTFGVVISAQLIAAILFDHFGVLHSPHPVTWDRVAGSLLLLAGLWLILRSRI